MPKLHRCYSRRVEVYSSMFSTIKVCLTCGQYWQYFESLGKKHGARVDYEYALSRIEQSERLQSIMRTMSRTK